MRLVDYRAGKSPQWELDLINRDPEEYERHRRRLKQQKRRGNQSNVERTGAPQTIAPDFGQERERQSTDESSGAPQDTQPFSDQNHEWVRSFAYRDDVDSFIVRFLAAIYCGTLPPDLKVAVPDFNAVRQHFLDTGEIDWTAEAQHPPSVSDVGPVDIHPATHQTPGEASEEAKDLLRQQTAELVRLFQLQIQRRAGEIQESNE
jgi:hypothetical protein